MPAASGQGCCCCFIASCREPLACENLCWGGRLLLPPTWMPPPHSPSRGSDASTENHPAAPSGLPAVLVVRPWFAERMGGGRAVWTAVAVLLHPGVKAWPHGPRGPRLFLGGREGCTQSPWYLKGGHARPKKAGPPRASSAACDLTQDGLRGDERRREPCVPRLGAPQAEPHAGAAAQRPRPAQRPCLQTRLFQFVPLSGR